ncbi:DUF3293 domain-containing protein [Pollutimonas bauzanensis]|uniref:DUF3293 domain-containing protein n=1 Tax=Pollutimonas bauzanensis TaxID=658167 RepID=A0A1M6AXX9_9BURK|nr:DUF3293 domain-containing protein [Pollutimonas bauzanensis]SHI41063.1 Protein of unknown function [Pollutimonas bauzanensis]
MIQINKALLAAFQNANYAVHAPGARLTLRIGRHSAGLAALLTQYGQPGIAILTAFNPCAITASDHENRRAQQSLRRAVRALGLPCFNGENSAADGDGPSEPTVAVLGISRSQGQALARRFRQLAFVYADRDAVPELVWTGQPRI